MCAGGVPRFSRKVRLLLLLPAGRRGPGAMMPVVGKKGTPPSPSPGTRAPGYTLRGLIFGLPVAGTVTPLAVRRGGALARRPATAGQPPSATPAKAT